MTIDSVKNVPVRRIDNASKQVDKLMPDDGR